MSISAADFATQTTRHDRNNFGVLRLGFATLVLLSHSYPLTTGSNSLEPLSLLTRGMTAGELSVNAFFLISGYLVTQSWLRSRSAEDYLRKRVLRIYPGYLVAMVFSVGVAAVCSGRGPMGYLRQAGSRGDSVVDLLFFLEPSAINNPAAFGTNPFPGAVNGSLWTLLPELRCYMVLMGVGVLGALRNRWFVGALLVGLYSWFVVLEWSRTSSTTRLYVYFFVGVVLALSPREVLRLTWPRSLSAMAILGAAACTPHGFALSLPWAGGYLILGLALERRSIGAAFFAKHDLSYGIYLYAFPVQQAVEHLWRFGSPGELSAVALPITVALAWCSWHFVESPAIRWRIPPGPQAPGR